LNKLLLALLLVLLCIYTILPCSATITTEGATVNATCVQMSGSNDGAAESVWFDYGHISNHGFSSSTHNITASGTFTALRCDEPTFLPGEEYKFRACGAESGCGAEDSFTMNVLIPHALTNFSVQGQAFIDQGGNPSWMAAHIWDVYVVAWGGWFFLLMISFVMMNITIKQKSVAISFLLMLISGGVLFNYAPPQTQQIAMLLMALALAGLGFWLYKRKR
jgi:LPXTG-motif cell wall-anchored protein